MNAAATIARLGTGTYTVTRQSPSDYGDDGRLQDPTTSTFDVVASVQPVNGRELQRLPEGLRTSEVRKLYTATQLKTQGAAQDPDLIQIDGDSWEVQTVERWDILGGYWKVLVSKVGH
jgi:hypothetical protein